MRRPSPGLAIGVPLALRGLVALGSCTGDLCIFLAMLGGLVLLCAGLGGVLLRMTALVQRRGRDWGWGCSRAALR
jgi:hypothetical protein